MLSGSGRAEKPEERQSRSLASCARFPLPSSGEGGRSSSSVIPVSADGVEGTAWHRHRGGPMRGGQCVSVSSSRGGGPEGVQSSSYQRP